MQAWLSWALVLALGGAAYLYYGQNARRGRNRGRSLNTTTGRGEPIQWSDSEPIAKKASKAAKTTRKVVKKTVQEVGEKAQDYISGASTTGADADDDLSPTVSPDLTPSGKDVSDMLEPQGPAASVLRINPSEKPARQNKPQQQRPEIAQETKKQRQNRKRKEEEKAQREAAEKERKTLENDQRRRAREARGEPAKNGLQNAQAPTSNAWSSGRPATGPAPAATQNGGLLDTFDPDAASTASSSAATNGTAPTTDSLGNSAHWTHLPSEEEQMAMAMQDTAWETVPKGKKKKNKAESETTEGSDAGTVPTPAPVPVKNSRPKLSENAKPSSRYEVLAEPITDAGHPNDSDWPVA